MGKKFKSLCIGVSFGAVTYLLFGLSGLLGKSDSEIAGIVTDETGRPVPGALVGILDEKIASMNEDETDGSGRFHFNDLSSQALYRIVVTKSGYSQTSLEKVRPSPQELQIQIRRTSGSLGEISSPLFPDPKPAEMYEGGQEPSFKLGVSTQEILLNVAVEDSLGNLILDLRKEDFRVLQDGVPQEIRYFGNETLPLSVVLLVDTSSGMQGSPMVDAKVAALAFIEQRRPQDVFSLMAFNDRVEAVTPFTQEIPQLRTAIHSLTPRGGRALYDALSRALDVMQEAPHPRHVIVLLSNGKDEASSTEFRVIDEKIQASDAVVFSIGEYPDLDRKLFMSGKKYHKLPEHDVNLNPVWILRYFSELSGGRAFFPTLGDPLEPFFAQIAAELHRQYVFTYQPTPMRGHGNFHSLDVQVKNSKDSVPYRVRSRKGYLRSH